MATNTPGSQDPRDRFGQWNETFPATIYQAEPWLRGRIDRVSVPAQPDFVPTNVPGSHQIVACLGPTGYRAYQKGATGGGMQYQNALIVPRSILICSAETNSEPHVTRWSHPAEFLSLSIDDAAFASVAEAADLDIASIEFLDRHPTASTPFDDDVLFALMLAMSDELLAEESMASTANPAGRVYAESLMQAAAAHILRYHTARRLMREANSGGLTSTQVDRVRAYARAHLADDISLADLAAAADLSMYHFAREFKRSTGETAHGMLRRKRMEHAAIALRETPHSVASVALDVGYASPSRFAAAFRKHTGVSPTVYRRDH